MIYKWINVDNGQSSTTKTTNADHIARLDAFIAENKIEKDDEGRYIVNDEIRDVILGGLDVVL